MSSRSNNRHPALNARDISSDTRCTNLPAQAVRGLQSDHLLKPESVPVLRLRPYPTARHAWELPKGSWMTLPTELRWHVCRYLPRKYLGCTSTYHPVLDLDSRFPIYWTNDYEFSPHLFQVSHEFTANLQDSTRFHQPPYRPILICRGNQCRAFETVDVLLNDAKGFDTLLVERQNSSRKAERLRRWSIEIPCRHYRRSLIRNLDPYCPLQPDDLDAKVSSLREFLKTILPLLRYHKTVEVYAFIERDGTSEMWNNYVIPHLAGLSDGTFAPIMNSRVRYKVTVLLSKHDEFLEQQIESYKSLSWRFATKNEIKLFESRAKPRRKETGAGV